MATAKRNAQVNALSAHWVELKNSAPKNSKYFIQWEQAFNSKPATDKEPDRVVWGQKYFMDNYSRRFGGHCGATKRTHTHHPDGWELELFVVKRYKWHGWDAIGEGSGNQMIDEIDCWERLADTDEADLLCPILKWFKVRSDKCAPLTEKAKDRVVIIAQKAVYVSDMVDACNHAERLNRENGFHGKSSRRRVEELKNMANRHHWRDVEFNPGNSGVIFDYNLNCYKAVFIDYAL